MKTKAKVPTPKAGKKRDSKYNGKLKINTTFECAVNTMLTYRKPTK